MAPKLESPSLYTIGWIAALSIERAAAIALLDERHDEPMNFIQHPSDANSYSWGRVGDHNIVIASLAAGVYGTTSTATTTSNLIASLPHIRIGLLVGIGGALAQPERGRDIRLGDVVVSQPNGITGGVVQYDLGKAKMDDVWERKGSLGSPPPVLLHALSNLQAEHEIEPSKVPSLLQKMWSKNPLMLRSKSGYFHQGLENDRLFRPEYNHIEGDTCDTCDSSFEIKRDKRDHVDPEFYYGVIASGNTLIKDAYTRDNISRLVGDECLCVEMEAAGLMNHFPCIVIRGICDYADSHKNDRWQRYAAATAAAFAVELLGRVPARQLEATRRVDDVIKSFGEDLGEVKYTVNNTREGVEHLREDVKGLDHKTILGQIPIASGASFDSYAEERNPTCLPDTRVELLDTVRQWASDFEAKPIFWLNGMAGTGKSTISRTLAQSWHKSHLASQLISSNPQLAVHIKEAISLDHGIFERGLNDQITGLILGPLSKLQHEEQPSNPLIIIIDALDECERDDDIKTVISLFSSASSQFSRLRIFLTSRPELPIRLGFDAITGNYKDFILHKISEPTIRHDISVFFNIELGKIRNNFNASAEEERQLKPGWPGKRNIMKLVNMAVPLFIFASTICRFIEDTKQGNPDRQLAEVLSQKRNGHSSKLEMTYSPILQRQLKGTHGKQKEKIIGDFQRIFGAIITLSSPLSIPALSRMLNLPQNLVVDRLDPLRSVLSLPSSPSSPVRLLHLSFRDYLIDSELKSRNEFWIDEKLVHSHLSRCCLQIMSISLRQDICHLKLPGTEIQLVKDSQINKNISEELKYACLYWIHHAKAGNNDMDDVTAIFGFLKKHFLHWLEVMSLIGRIPDSILMLKELRVWLKGRNHDLQTFVDDAVRFLLVNSLSISNAPLQLYSSSLIFLPKKSVIRIIFKNTVPKWISCWPNIERHWDSCLSTLLGHQDKIISAIFSRDSKLIASASADNTVRIWDVETSQCKDIIRMENPIISICFSHNSGLLAIADETGVEFMNMHTSKFEWFLEQSDAPRSITFAHDSDVLALACGKKIQIWNINSHKHLGNFEEHSDIIQSVVFSHDSIRLVSASMDKTARIWNVQTGECEQVLPHRHAVVTAVFSHDSKLLATACKKKVQIWNAKTGESKCSIQDSASTLSLTFLHNSKIIATAQKDFVSICLADTGKGSEFKYLQGHTEQITSVCLSDDSKLLLSSSHDRTLRIWNIGRAIIKEDRQHNNGVDSIFFPHDSEFFASNSDDGIRIWNSTTGKCKRIIQCEGYNFDLPLALSHTSRLVMLPLKDNSIHIWDIETGKRRWKLEGHKDEVNSAIFSHKSRFVVSSSDDKSIRMWDLKKKGRCRQILYGHRNQAYLAVFSHESKLVASASWDMTIRVWNVDTNECLQVLRGFSLRLISLLFSHDSELLTACSRGKVIYIWRVHTGELKRTIQREDFPTKILFGIEDDSIVLDDEIVPLDQNPTRVQNSRILNGIGIYEDTQWITWCGKKILALPVYCRYGKCAISGNKVVIGCRTGRVLMIGFNVAHLKKFLE